MTGTTGCSHGHDVQRLVQVSHKVNQEAEELSLQWGGEGGGRGDRTRGCWEDDRGHSWSWSWQKWTRQLPRTFSKAVLAGDARTLKEEFTAHTTL
jgi:hypothetical protein